MSCPSHGICYGPAGGGQTFITERLLAPSANERVKEDLSQASMEAERSRFVEKMDEHGLHVARILTPPTMCCSFIRWLVLQGQLRWSHHIGQTYLPQLAQRPSA